MSEFFPKRKSLGGRVKLGFDWSNYATKADLKSTAAVDTSKFAWKVDLASLKFEFDKLYIDKLEKLPTGLNSLKNKVDKLDVDKLVPVPVDLSKLNYIVKIMLKRLNMMNWLKKLTLFRLLILVNQSQKLTIIQNLMKLKKNTDHDHSNKCITTQEFNKLTWKKFAARLAQAKMILLLS